MPKRESLLKQVARNAQERGKDENIARLYTILIVISSMVITFIIAYYYVQHNIDFILSDLLAIFEYPIEDLADVYIKIIIIICIVFPVEIGRLIGSELALFISRQGEPIIVITKVLASEQLEEEEVASTTVLLEHPCQIIVFREETILSSFYPVDIFLNGKWVGAVSPGKKLEFMTETIENGITINLANPENVWEYMFFRGISSGQVDIYIKGESFQPLKTAYHESTIPAWYYGPPVRENPAYESQANAETFKDPNARIPLVPDTSSDNPLSFCPFCGALSSENAEFCLTCGHSIH